MRLLTVVLRNPEHVEAVRGAVQRLGAQEVTVLESKAAADLTTGGGPLTAALRRVLTGMGDEGTVIMALVEGRVAEGGLVERLRRSGIDLSRPATGFAFTMPIEWATVGSAGDAT